MTSFHWSVRRELDERLFCAAKHGYGVKVPTQMMDLAQKRIETLNLKVRVLEDADPDAKLTGRRT